MLDLRSRLSFKRMQLEYIGHTCRGMGSRRTELRYGQENVRCQVLSDVRERCVLYPKGQFLGRVQRELLRVQGMERQLRKLYAV